MQANEQAAPAVMVEPPPHRVNDPATYDDPHHFAAGFTGVIVNGGIVMKDGESDRPHLAGWAQRA